MSVSAAPATLPLRVPWTTVVGAALVAGLFTLWTLGLPASADSTLTLRLMQLALAATAAYLLDDASAALTATSPRSWWRRRAFALTIGLAAVAVSWSVVLLLLSRTPHAPLGALTLEVAVLVVVALGASAVLAKGGEPEPGNLVAVALPLTGVAALLVGGMLGFDIFVSSPGPDQTVRTAAWVVAGGVALAVMGWASRDTPT
jgi:hypothetical protein